MKRYYLEKACEEIDASIFSGDVLFDDKDRKQLKEYMKRWIKEIDSHEKYMDELYVEEQR